MHVYPQVSIRSHFKCHVHAILQVGVEAFETVEFEDLTQSS